MKKWLFLWLILAAIRGLTAQNIVQAEYFIDQEPGFGNGTPLSFGVSDDITLNFSVDVSGLPNGFHTFYVRGKDENGNWSAFNTLTFFTSYVNTTPTSVNIVAMEYFMDTDPGFGNGTVIAVTPATTVTKSFSIDMTALSGGFHTLYVRSRDANGLWNVAPASVFYRVPDAIVDPLADLVKMEYFIDKDPGLYNGTDVPIVAGSTVTKSFSIDMTNVSGGFHTLYVRTQDADGLWNVAPASVFYRVPDAIVDPLANLVKMEYFIDKDPGFGNAINVAITLGADVTKSFSIDMTNVSGGFHTLYVRTQDADGLWNVAPASVFYRVPDVIVDPLANLVKMEYFIDKDPGFGNAIDVAITPGADVTKSFSIDMTNVSGGFHTLYVRTQDTDGLWNVAPASAFYRVPDALIDPLANITKMEYFIDKDPGLGFANDLSVSAGSDITKSATIDLTNLSGGFHVLYLRSKDADDLWSITQAQAFYKPPGVLSSTASPIASVDYYFTKGSVSTAKYSYSLFVPANDVQITFNPVLTDLMADSTYEIHVLAKDSNGKSSLLNSVQFTVDTLWLVIPNSNPVASSDAVTATGGVAQVIHVLNNDTDVDGDALSIVSVVSTPSHGTAVKNSGDTTITYTAVISYSGSDQFTYAMSDGQGGLDTATVTITVTPGGTLALSTSVLQNPALSKYADFFVISDTTLTGAPAVKLFVGTDSTAIAMSATSNVRIYKGAITFTQSGNYSIRTQATAVNGAGSIDNHPFNVALSKPGLSATLSSVNGKALLKLGTKAVKEETYFTAFENEESQEMIYEFGPGGSLHDAVELSITYDPQNYPDAGKLFIYHKQGDNWIRQRTQVYTGELLVRTKVSVLGQFKLGYDPSYEGTNVVPSVFALKQNYPNPFNPSTTITYDVPEDTKLNLTIYNLLGQKVKTLYTGNQLAGTYHTIWNGTNERGQTVASGIYFYRLETKSFVRTQKMLFIK